MLLPVGPFFAAARDSVADRGGSSQSTQV